MTDLSPGVREYLLAFADDEHLMGQQHTEWIGVTPFLEEDLAFASIGQDELGHAALLYAALVGDDDAAIDELAFFRHPSEYRSCWLVERGGDDWAEAIVRHWLYDAAEELRWSALTDSALPAVADAAVRGLAEERFHRRHADSILDVLLADPDAEGKLLAARDTLLPLALAMFEPVAGEAEAVEAGVAHHRFADHITTWQDRVDERFGAVDWSAVTAPDQSARTERSPDFAPLIARIREVFDIDREAVW